MKMHPYATRAALNPIGPFCPARTCPILQLAGRAHESNVATDMKSHARRSTVRISDRNLVDMLCEWGAVGWCRTAVGDHGRTNRLDKI